MTQQGPYRLDQFSGFVGETYGILYGDGQTLTVELLEAVSRDPNKDADPSDPVTVFSLLFRDPDGSVEAFLPQGTYPIEHHSVQDLAVFVVPLGPDNNGAGMLYEVIFNNPPGLTRRA